MKDRPSGCSPVDYHSPSFLKRTSEEGVVNHGDESRWPVTSGHGQAGFPRAPPPGGRRPPGIFRSGSEC